MPSTYFTQLVHAWPAFQRAELHAAAEAAEVSLAIEEGTNPVLVNLTLPDETSMIRVASRTILIKQAIHVWASATSWEELAAALMAYPRDLAAPYLAEGSTFRVNVCSSGKKLSSDERTVLIQRLATLLPWKGKVDLKSSDHTFVIFVESLAPETNQSTAHATTRYYFGRLIAEGRRDLVGKLDLKRRNVRVPPAEDCLEDCPTAVSDTAPSYTCARACVFFGYSTLAPRRSTLSSPSSWQI